jgi:Ca2+-binding EF-hand superfamily protein
MVHYYHMMDEIDLINKGINPLMTWAEELAEYIVKAIVANDTDYKSLFLKHSSSGKYLSEKEFITTMEDIHVNDKFKVDILKKFYYFIDNDKNQQVDFKELESIVKTHCTKTNLKMTNEILDSVKSQMSVNKLGIKDVYSALDKYSYKELIDRKSFTKGLIKDLRIRLSDIDIDFISVLYRDKKDIKSVRYSQFMDDLKQKFELTETYVVPGKRRKEPDHVKDDVLRELTHKKTEPSREEREREINKILREVRSQAHDKRIDLKKEFREMSRRKNGLIPEAEFRKFIETRGFKISKGDGNKLVERFIEPDGNNIDTLIMTDIMYEDIADGFKAQELYKPVVQTPILGKVARKLEKKGLCQDIIKNLKKKDISVTHYLPFEVIKDAFHESKFKLSKAQIAEMLSEIKRNMAGEYNYHILLSSMFGQNYNDKIVIPSNKQEDNKTERSQARDKRDRTEGKMQSSRSKDRRRRTGDRTEGKMNSSRSKDRRATNDERATREQREKLRESRKSRDPRDSRKSGDLRKTRTEVGHKSTANRDRSRQDMAKSRDRGSKSGDKYNRSKTRDQSQKTRGILKRPLGQQARAIGKRLSNSRYDYADHLRSYAQNDKEYILTDSQIYKLLDSARIRLTSEEKEEFIRDMGDTRFTVEEFLIN